ncbi:MAG: DUF4912 domain-containing protein [Candidatus Omnitrophica bacterium]|nr:DUF4912 domain-containing protein [Candidatus Omnitrophota bacterium]
MAKPVKNIRRTKKAISSKKATRPQARKSAQDKPAGIKKVILQTEELAIERAKFSHPQGAPVRRATPQDLPYQYGRDKIVLQVRDCRWLYSYWELGDTTLGKLKNEFRDDFYKAKRVLRVYDVSNINFDGRNAHRHFDITVDDYANNWYIDTAGPGKSWCVDLGLLFADGRFVTILRSNVVQTPLEGPSWITDEEWMIPEDMFARLYGMGFGLGRSSPKGAWQERIGMALSSGGLASMASPVKKMLKEKKFWLWVDCELIVYGATEPDAKLTVQGKNINLRQDGTFTLRFALPDGKQVIPVKAVSADNTQTRAVTPIVQRETK